jgi:outer membrane lipoprotein-sorting protein
MKTTILSLFLAIGFVSFAQSNKEAETLLKEVRQKTESYKTQVIDYVNEIEAPTGNANNPRSSRKTRGSAQIKGQKYRVDMGGFLLIHDGTQTFMVYPDDEEINVVDTEDQEVNLTPSGILSSYEKGYSYAMAGKETIDGKTIQYIRLKPKAAADVKEILLGIDMGSKQLYSYKQFAHDGVITTFTVEKYSVNTTLADALFSIKSAEFEGFEIYEE